MLSDLKLATGDVLKRIGPARRRAASSCNAFAIATFSSSLLAGIKLNYESESRDLPSDGKM